MATIQKEANKPLQESIIEAIDKIEKYMIANRLSLNRDKTQLMVVNKDPPLKIFSKHPCKPQEYNIRKLP